MEGIALTKTIPLANGTADTGSCLLSWSHHPPVHQLLSGSLTSTLILDRFILAFSSLHWFFFHLKHSLPCSTHGFVHGHVLLVGLVTTQMSPCQKAFMSLATFFFFLGTFQYLKLSYAP